MKMKKENTLFDGKNFPTVFYNKANYYICHYFVPGSALFFS